MHIPYYLLLFLLLCVRCCCHVFVSTKSILFLKSFKIAPLWHQPGSKTLSWFLLRNTWGMLISMTDLEMIQDSKIRAVSIIKPMETDKHKTQQYVYDRHTYLFVFCNISYFGPSRGPKSHCMCVCVCIR